jgi:outer membrane protein assembly factor BamD
MICVAETWRLGRDQQWQKATDSNESAFATMASQAKQYVSTGKAGKAKKEYASLKRQFPQVAGEDYDDYVKAELLYAKRKFPEAAQSYQNFIEKYPESALRQSALEREFQIGSAFLNGQKRSMLKVFRVTAYDEGEEIMYKIADTEGDAPISKKALVTLAQSFERRGDEDPCIYEKAYLTWSEASNRWPTGDMGQQSLLGMGRSLEKAYKGPKYDSKVLEGAKNYYSQYIERYPESAEEMGLPQKIVIIEKDLSEKELAIANYYERTESYKAAHMYYQKIAELWPGSNAGKIAESKLPQMKKLVAESEMPKKKKFNWKGLFL